MVSGGCCLQLAVVLFLLPRASLQQKTVRLSAAGCANFYLPLDTSTASSNMFVFYQQVAAMVVNNPAIRTAYDRIGW